jgi:prepilin-type N-terminal cleavage/methylation domain-containing protein/prepilin-type processing-associated H-X9-DG protein
MAALNQHRNETRRAFTLVELLVVIGIIAVLISILLPALSKVRRQANTLQCSSNMRQVATALIMYINDSKGRFPPAGLPPIAACPNGWWWPNELVRLNYIKTKSISVYKKPGDTVKKFNRNNPFRCPEGVDDDYSQGSAFPQGDYPTDGLNNGFTMINDGNPGCQGDGLGIPSWYQLNCRVANNITPMYWPGGTAATPFAWFNTADTTANPGVINDGRFRRTWGAVKKSGELVMVLEAANPNFHDPTVSSKYPNLYLKKLSARHGTKSANGANAYFNMAFFDGHVALFPSFDFNTPPTGSVYPEDKFKSGTIFWLGHQF